MHVRGTRRSSRWLAAGLLLLCAVLGGALWLVLRSAATSAGEPVAGARAAAPPATDAPVLQAPDAGSQEDRAPPEVEPGAQPPAPGPVRAAPEPTVALEARFVGPDFARLEPERAEIELVDAGGARRIERTAAQASIRIPGLARGPCTVDVRAGGFTHRRQFFDLTQSGDGGRGGADGAEPTLEERLVLWPDGWIAVVVSTADGRPFDELAGDLGLEPKRLFVDAFEARVRRDAPGDGAWSEPADGAIAVFRRPPKYQSWSLPGGIVGSLQLLQPGPVWIGLRMLGTPLGWELAPEGAREVVFRVDAGAVSERLGRLTLRAVDAASGAPLADARASLIADTSAHRRKDQLDVRADAEGRIAFERIVPGRYELSVMRGETLHQDRFELAPGESRDVGDVALGAGAAILVRVVDGDGAPATAWIRIGPYRAGARSEDLFPPLRSRHTDAGGEFRLPAPEGPSIVCAEYMDPSGQSSSGVFSAIQRIDPGGDAGRPLVLVVRKACEVRFDGEAPDGAQLAIVDALDLTVAELRANDGSWPRARLVAGTYRARVAGGQGEELGTTEFVVVGDPPVTVTLR